MGHRAPEFTHRPYLYWSAEKCIWFVQFLHTMAKAFEFVFMVPKSCEVICLCIRLPMVSAILEADFQPPV